jgi:hypothetical protein
MLQPMTPDRSGGGAEVSTRRQRPRTRYDSLILSPDARARIRRTMGPLRRAGAWPPPARELVTSVATRSLEPPCGAGQAWTPAARVRSRPITCPLGHEDRAPGHDNYVGETLEPTSMAQEDIV